MSKFVFIKESKVVTDSLTIAKMFKRDHKDVIREICYHIEHANIKFSQSNFSLSTYQSMGKQYTKINLTEEAFKLVVLSFNKRGAVPIMIRFVQEFYRMELTLEPLQDPSYLIVDPIRRAEKWIEEQKSLQSLQQQHMVQEQEKIIAYAKGFNKLLTTSDSL